jgi:hypothetical protein
MELLSIDKFAKKVGVNTRYYSTEQLKHFGKASNINAINMVLNLLKLISGSRHQKLVLVVVKLKKI